MRSSVEHGNGVIRPAGADAHDTDVIEQLAEAIEAARQTGRLQDDTEAGAWFSFVLPDEEYRALPGVEVTDEEGPSGAYKTAYQVDNHWILAVPESSV